MFRKKITTLPKKQAGIAPLGLVLVVTVVMVLTTLSIQNLTLFSTRLSQTKIAEKISIYSAEGLTSDTLSHMVNTQFSWPAVAVGDTDTYTVKDENNIELARVISHPTQDEYYIDVTAKKFNASRRLVTRISTAPSTTDLVLLIDASNSMDDHGCTGPCQPITNILQDARMFVNSISDNYISSDTQIGIVTFNTNTNIKNSLTMDFPDIIEKLNYQPLFEHSNLDQGLIAARNLLINNGRPGAYKSIVVFSDGLTNRHGSPATTCDGYPSTDTACTNQALQTADNLKVVDGINLYTLVYTPPAPIGYINQPQIDFATAFMKQLASTPDTQYAFTNANRTDSVISIFNHIYLVGSYFTFEVAPGEVIP